MTPTTIAITIIAVLAVAGWVAISRSRQARSHAAVPADVQAAQRNFILVVLRRAPAVLRPEAVAAAAQSAWTGRFGANEDGSEYVERGVPGVMYVLQAHSLRQSSCQNHLVGLWDDYTHDVAVSVTYNFDTDSSRLAAFVSTLAALFCDDQSIAVYHPASRRLWALDQQVRMKLADGSAAFFDQPTSGAQ